MNIEDGFGFFESNLNLRTYSKQFFIFITYQSM